MLKTALNVRWPISAYFVGAILIAIAVLPEFIPGSSPGFGPMQISAAIGATSALLLGTYLLRRTDSREVRRHLLAIGVKTGKFGAKLLLCVMSLIVVAAAAEGWARWRARPSEEQRHWFEMIKDLPEAEQLAKDREEWNNFYSLAYHDYYLYGVRPRKRPTSTFTSFFGDRLCPNSVPDQLADQRIWFFGGSTMMNFETTDERTIANSAIKRLNESGIRAAGHNFGMATFQSCQELTKFQEILRRVSEGQRPTIVIFYDGFNDANYGYYFGAGRMQADISSRLQMLIEHHHWDMVRVGIVEGLFRKSQFYQDYGRWLTRLPSAVGGTSRDASDANLEQAVHIYQANMEMVRGICRQFQIRPLFVLQPLVVTKQSRTKGKGEIYQSVVKDGLADFVERFYASAGKTMADSPDFVDLSHILDHDGRTDFYDLGHTGPYTGAVIGEAMGDAILERVPH